MLDPLTQTKMHVLIITPHQLQGSMLVNALKRKNLKSMTCLPSSLNYEWFPETDAVLIPHPLSIKQWQLIKRFLSNLKVNIPLVTLGSINQLIFERTEFCEILPRIVPINESLKLDQIPLILKESIKRSFQTIKTTKINVGSVELDRNKRKVSISGVASFLTKKEFYLLELLMLNAGQVISRDAIIDYVWDRRSFVAPNTIDVYISRLRKKIDKRVNKTFITTVPCLGYQFEKRGTLQRQHM